MAKLTTSSDIGAFLAAANKAAGRAALGSGTKGDELFTAANIDAVETALGFYFPVTARTTSAVNRASTTTFAADPTLTLPVVANARYKLDFYFHFVAGAGGAKAQITLPSVVGHPGSAQGGGFARFDLTFQPLLVATTVSLGSIATSTTGRGLAGWILFETGGSGGNCVLEWAQQTSDAANTTRSANSFMVLTRQP